MHFSKLATALALFGLAVAAPVDADNDTDELVDPAVVDERVIQQGLAQAWKKGYIGTALTIRDDPVEQYIVSSPYDFDSITPENAMKWESVEPVRNNFTFSDADRYVNYSKTYNKQLRCHTLVWHSQLPPWVTAGNFDNATLIGIMENHIKNVAGRWGASCTYWDVVNEALNEDGTYRESVWYNTIGEAYLPMAFKFAQKYSPKSKLFYNDYNIEGGAKAAGAQRIVKLVQSYGMKIDGVGIQAHLTSEPTTSSGGSVAVNLATIKKTLKGFTDLNVDVAFTELDVRFYTPATKQKLNVQADVYRRFTKACVQNSRCVGITVWGVSDLHSWIPGVFAGEGAALLFDENYQKKPAYYAVLNVLLNQNKK